MLSDARTADIQCGYLSEDNANCNCKRLDVCFGFANQFFLIANQSEIVEQNCYSFLKVYFHHCKKAVLSQR